MRGPKPKHRIELTTEEEQSLRRVASAHKSPQAKAVRARIVLLAFDHPGWSNQQIAREAGCTDWTVRKWRRRWVATRSIEDLPRPGAPRRFSP
jgi:transposase-like protein